MQDRFIHVFRVMAGGLKVRWVPIVLPQFPALRTLGKHNMSCIITQGRYTPTLQTDVTRQTSFQWQIGGRGGWWVTLLGYKVLNDGLYLLFQSHSSLTPHTFYVSTTGNPNNLCIHVSSAFTLIIHVFEFWSQGMLFPRCFSELCAVRLAFMSQGGSEPNRCFTIHRCLTIPPTY